MSKRVHAPELREACLVALQAGQSLREVSAAHNVPIGTLKTWCHRSGLVVQKDPDAKPAAKPRPRGPLSFAELGPEARAKLPQIVSESLNKALEADKGADAYHFLRAVQVAGEICPELLTGIKGGEKDEHRSRRDQLRELVAQRRLGGTG